MGILEEQTYYFSHSELCLPLANFALVLLFRNKAVWAFALAGLVFDINAFEGVWLVCVLTICEGRRFLSSGDLRAIIIGGATFVLAASPEIYWIAGIVLDSKPTAAFDYAQFLWSYFPQHFFIAAASPLQLAEFIAMTASGLLALRRIASSDNWRTAFLGFLAVFAIGVVLPLLTHNRLLLDLHLLRADGNLIALAMVFVVAASVSLPHRKLVPIVAALLSGSWIVTCVSLLALELPERRTALGPALIL